MTASQNLDSQQVLFQGHKTKPTQTLTQDVHNILVTNSCSLILTIFNSSRLILLILFS